MESLKLNSKLVKNIQDSRFDENELHRYILILQLGIRDFQLAIMSDDNRVLRMEDYVFGELTSYEEWLRLVKDIYDNHPLLNVRYWKEVKIVIKNKKFIHVPETLFEPENPAKYLPFNAHLNDSDQVLYTIDSSTNIVTIFSFPSNIYRWLVDLYQNTKPVFYHQSTSLIVGWLASPQPQTPSLYLYIDRFKLHLCHVRDGKLIYYNQFVIKQFSDYIKYTMQVVKGLHLNQEDTTMILWGYIGKNTPHYQEFCRYIRHVQFGERPEYLRFGYLFDEVQNHQFFDLYANYLLN